MKTKNPKLTQAQLMKAVSDKWRGLSQQKRQKYEKLALLEKQRYLEDTEQFTREFKRVFADLQEGDHIIEQDHEDVSQNGIDSSDTISFQQNSQNQLSD